MCQAALTSVVGADLVNGYSANVVSEIVSKWQPPKLFGAFSTQLRIQIDARGRVLECVTVRSSGLEAFDQVACSAVYAAQPFDRPPNKTPIEIFLVFQQAGQHEKSDKRETLSDAQALRAELEARAKLERLIQGEAAGEAEVQARMRAEEVAKSLGKPLPQKLRVEDKKDNFPSEQPYLQSDSFKHKIEKQASQENNKANLNADVKQTANKQYTSTNFNTYIKDLEEFLAKEVVLQTKTLKVVPPVTLKLVIAANGKVVNAKIIKSTGYKSLDNQVLRKIVNMEQVFAPPSELVDKNIFVILHCKAQKLQP